MRTIFRAVIGVTLFFAGATSIADEANISFSSTKMNENLFMLKGEGGFTGGNIAVLTGKDGTILIDNSMPPFLDKLNASVANITGGKQVDFLINTHLHKDHMGNNGGMKKLGARIFAHANMREGLLKNQKDDITQDDLPVFSLNDNMSFYLNAEQAHVRHTPKAHTDGDLFIHFEKANVIHTGDLLFNGMFPFIDLSSGGSIDGYIEAQRTILSLCNKDTRIIPGHGPLAKCEDLNASMLMIEDSKAIIHALVKAGKTEDEVVAMNPLAKYHEKWHWGFITTERMTKQMYQGLSSKSAHHKHDKAYKNHKH